MKTSAKIAALIGLAAATAVVVWLGAGQIWKALSSLGWTGLAEVVGWQFAVFLVMGLAWWIVCPGGRLWVVAWARLVREGGLTCLPLSVVGGFVFGARALVVGRVGFATAIASSAADVIAEGIAL